MAHSNILFTTPRLQVRHWRDDDLPALMAVYANADAMRWVGDGQPISEAECRRWLEVTHRNYAVRGYGMFALEEVLGGAIIGFAGLVHPGGQPEAELKYALMRQCWGRGFATEAARGLLAYGAREHGLRRIIATTAPENHASHRVLEKAGMQRGELVTEEDGSLTLLFSWTPPSAG